MAAYSKSITAAGMKLIFESMQNINDKEILYSIIDTLNTEYAKIASQGITVYTVTTGLQATLEAKLRRMANSVQVEILKSFFVIMVAEFTAVAAGNAGYTQTDNSTLGGAFAIFEYMLKNSIENLCEVENRKMFHLLIAQIIAEHVILVATDA
jgi:Ni,Fe-hydrogenase I cytochrome b subunit